MSSLPDEDLVEFGDTQRFECQVIGYPAPSVSWYKNNVDITNDPKYNIHYDPDKGLIALSIKNVSPDDEGTYMCRAENCEGYASTTAYLLVKVDRSHGVGKQYMAMMIENISEEEHSQVEVLKSGRQTVIEEVITRVQETEKEVIEEKAIVPKITYDSALNNPIELRMNSTLYIEVDIMGYPQPEVTWSHGEDTLEEDTRVTLENNEGWSYIKVKNIKAADGGIYKVKAENKVGRHHADFRVSVKGPPSSPQNLRVKEVYKDYIVLVWDSPLETGGDPIKGYHIEKSLGGAMFVSAGQCRATATEFRVTKLFEGTEYMFRVTAVNAIGESEPASLDKLVKAKMPFDPPSAPRNLRIIEPHPDHITIGWEAPETDGGSPVTQYIIEKKDATRVSGVWVVVDTVGAEERQYKATKLFQGNAYLFRVTAENRVGPGEGIELEEPCVAKLPYDKPHPPRNLMAKETNSDYIVIKWEPPESDGGAPITGYIIEKRDSKRPGYIYVADVKSSVTEYKVTRLFEGYDYLFRVIAENAVGPSKPCEMEKPVKAKLPYDEPSSPRNLRVTDYWTDFITLAWEPPETDGGSPITGYIIEKRDAIRPTWVKAATLTPDNNSYQVSNLFEGAEYYFRVFAENKVGPSLQAAELETPQKAKMPFDPPLAPEKLKVLEYGPSFVELSWEAPENNGGSEITKYIIEKRDAIMSMWTQAGTVSKDTYKYRVENLFEGQQYFFRVAGENQCGRGQYVDTEKPVTAKLPYNRPAAPRDLRTTDIWKDYISIAWEAPDTDGGSPITGYNIEQRDAYDVGYRFIATVEPNVNTYQLTNLQEGHEYNFRLFAKNAAGLSESPAEIRPAVKARVPFDPPSPPRKLRVTGTAPGRISLEWEPSDFDGGSPVTGYIIEIRSKNSLSYTKAASVDGQTFSTDLLDLIDGAEYYVRVLAENLAGISKTGAELDKPVAARTPIKAPSVPKNLSVPLVGKNSICIAWEPPDNDGGAKLTGYTVEMKHVNEPEYGLVGIVDASSTKYTAYGLNTGEGYMFRVRAQNSSGLSQEGAEFDKPIIPKLPYGPPMPPSNFGVREAERNWIALSWNHPDVDKNCPLSGYSIEIKGPDDRDFRPLMDLPPEVNTYTARNLIQGGEYDFRIRSQNPAGYSLDSVQLDKLAVAKPSFNPPSAPQKFHVKDSTSDMIALTWKPPAFDGGAPLNGYNIEIKGPNDDTFKPLVELPPDCNKYKARGLKDGAQYDFRITAQNAAGVSAEPAGLDKPAIAKLPYEPPSKPNCFCAKNATKSSVVLTWSPSDSDGGSTITGYIIDIKRPGDSDFSFLTDVSDDTTKYTVRGLNEGQAYEFRIRAENRAGPGAGAVLEKPIVAKLPYDIPESPQKLKARNHTKDSVILSWTAPDCDGGSPLTGYTVEIRGPSDDDFKPVVDLPEDVTKYTARGLKEGRKYDFRVRAQNMAGLGDGINLDKPITAKHPFEPPDIPQKLKARNKGKDSIILSWSPPDSDGGAPLTGYIVDIKCPRDTEFKLLDELPDDITKYTAKGLKEGQSYQFRVRAQNPAGNSESAELKDPVVARLPFSFPDAPCKLKARNSGADSVTLQWNPPESDGGSPVTGYKVEVRGPNDKDFKLVEELPDDVYKYKVRNLETGKDYVFRLSSQNTAGYGDPISLDGPIKAKLPFDVPDKPEKLKARNYSPDSVILTWSSPKSDGGSPLTGYAIDIKSPSDSDFKQHTELPDDSTKYTAKGLKEGKKYQFRVRALNAAGASEGMMLESPITAKHPYEPPSVPKNFKVVNATQNCVLLSWTPSDLDNSSPVTGYKIEKKSTYDSEFIPLTDLSEDDTKYTVKGLVGGETYDFRITAYNPAGDSDSVTLSKPVTTKPKPESPSSPQSLTTDTTSADNIKLHWNSPISDGGADLTGYTIEYKQVGDTTFKKLAQVMPDVNSYKAKNLIPEAEYEFRVFAENEVGASEEPAVLTKPVCVKPAQEKPSAPTQLKVKEVKETSAVIEWAAPESDGGAPIKLYVVEKAQGDGPFCIAQVVDRSVMQATVFGLKEGESYNFRVLAENEVGRSEEAAQLDKPVVVKAATSEPGAPRKLQVGDVTSESITLTWDAPSFDGGSPITQYVIVSREASKKKFKKCGKVKDATSFTVSSNLEEGHEYDFRVYAENDVGISEEFTQLEKPVKIPEKVSEEVAAEVVEETATATVEEDGASVDVTDGITEDMVAPEEAKAPEEKPKEESKEETKEEAVPKEESPVAIDEVVAAENKKNLEKSAVEPEPLQEELVTPEEATPAAEAPKAVEPEEAVQVAEAPKEVVSEEVTPAMEAPKEEVSEEQVMEPDEVPTKVTVPGIPNALALGNVTSGSVELTWTKPDNDGGASIKRYVIVMRGTDQKKFKKVGKVDGDQTSFCVSDKIKAGGEYQFRVYAENSEGLSEEGAELEAPVKVPVEKAAAAPEEAVKPDKAAPAEKPVEEKPKEKKSPEKKVPPGAPAFLEEPQDVSVDIGETIRLTCKVKGEPEPTVEWYRGKKKIKVKKADKRIKMDWDMKDDCNFLQIDSATSEDSGEYTIKVSNDAGSTSATVNVTVSVAMKDEPVPEDTVDASESIKVETPKAEEQVVDEKVPEPEKPKDKSVKEEVKEVILDDGKIPGADKIAKELDEITQDIAYEEKVEEVEQKEVKEETTVVQEDKTVESEVAQTEKEPKEEKPVEDVVESEKELVVETKSDDKVEPSEEQPVATPVADEDLPKIEVLLDSVVVSEGEDIYIKIRAKGEPDPDVEFYKGKKKLKSKKSDKRVQIDWDMKEDVTYLCIKSATSDDSGDYTIKATNEKGTVSAKVTVEVKKEEPKEEPKPEVVAEEAIAPDATKEAEQAPKVEETPVVEEPSQEKEAVVTDEAKPMKPSFEMEPKPVTVTEGESIRLECKVSATIETTVYWEKNSKRIKSKKADRPITMGYDVETNIYFLEITSTKVDDTAEYTVVADNCGVLNQRTVRVLVNKKKPLAAPKLTRMPKSVSATEGETIRLSTKVSGNPEPEIKLLKNGKEITSDRVKMSAEGDSRSVVIIDSKTEDTGKYTLVAENSQGKVSHDIKIKVESEGVAPDFVDCPDSVQAKEGEELKVIIKVSGTPPPSIQWFKKGKPLKLGSKISVSSEGDTYTLYIKKVKASDAAEYTCSATNTAGSKDIKFTIKVDTLEIDSEKLNGNLSEKSGSKSEEELLSQLSPKIQEELNKLKESDNEASDSGILFKEYPMLDDYVDTDKGVKFKKGDVVEVMDTEIPTKWLVRKQAEKEKVCYVPVEYLLGKKDEPKEPVTEEVAKTEAPAEEAKPESEAESEAEDEVAEEKYPTYAAIADYTPSDTEVDALPLKEGELVEVMDSNNSDKWLVRLAANKAKQGWVPPSYLEPFREGEKLDTRSTREVFREDIIQIDDKSKEAIMKRRYALKDMWESEREYIKDLNFGVKSYSNMWDHKDLPEELKGQKDMIFSNYGDIHNFHQEKFLQDLLGCSNDPDSLGNVFLTHRDSFFGQYVPFFVDRSAANYVLDCEACRTFIQVYDDSIGNVGETKMSLSHCLARPWKRIDEYINLLQDFIKYTMKANQDCTKLEEAVEMLLDLKKRANDELALNRIVGYPGDLAELSPVLRHDDFIVWEGEATGKGKERHIFLFKNKLMLTKKIKPAKEGDLPTYEFKEMIDLKPEYALNEELTEEKRFEIWYASPKFDRYTFQARNVPSKKAWCDLLRKHFSKYEPGYIPSFTSSLINTTVDEGQSATFECIIDSDPAPEVTWLCNGKLIKAGDKYVITQDGNKYTLKVNNCNRELSGSYICRATNLKGTVECSSELTVNVHEVPEFTSRLRNIECLLGAEAKFECTVTGKPEPKITWYKGDKELKSSKRKKIKSDGDTYIMTFTKVEEGDLGEYTVKAVNCAGEHSVSAQLLITDLEERKKEKLPDFGAQMEDLVANEGSEAKVSVSVMGYPAPEIQWFVNNKLITDSDSNYGVTFDGTNATLNIRMVKTEDSGIYTCKLKNRLGEAENSCSVTVATKPKFTARFTDQDIFKGETAEFKCTLEGYPKSEVTWYHDKQVITETERIKIYSEGDKHWLVISKVIMNEKGEYTVKARNQAGEGVCSANLFITEDVLGEVITPESLAYAPSFTKKMTDNEILVGAQAKFVVKAIGEPAPQVKWLRKAKEVVENERIKITKDSGTFTLTIDKVTLEDAGLYMCLISNTAGDAKCSGSLVVDEPAPEPVEEKPKRSTEQLVPPTMPLDKPKLKEHEGDILDVSWYPAILPKNAKQTEILYMIERKDLSGGDWVTVQKDVKQTSFVLKDYNPECDYLYRVRAFNEYGRSDPTMPTSYYGRPVAVEKKEKRQKEIPKAKLPPKSPRDKPEISSVTDDSLLLSWQPAELPPDSVETEIYYMVERRCPPSRNWIEIGTDIKKLNFLMDTYRPEKDYMFRIRAGNDYGISDPSLATTIFAKPADTGPSSKKEIEETKTKAKPRTVWDKPEITDLQEKSLVLKWKPSSIPNYAVQCPIWYIVEQRCPPNMEWERLATDVKECEYKINKINRKKDYYFRIRPVNDYGMAEPSMPAQLRRKEETDVFTPEPTTRRRSYSREPSIGSRGVPLHMRIPPEFIGKIDTNQYGVEGRKSSIYTHIKAYPEPKVTWYLRGHPIEMGTKFFSSLSQAGELVLDISDFSWAEVGLYKVKVENDVGTAEQEINVEMADPPTFLEPMKDQIFHLRQGGKLECRVHGIPYPKVTFKHDWRVIADSHRLKIVREDEDHWTLNMMNAIRLDEGMYECVAENVAGKVYCMATIKVTEKPGLYRDIRFNQVPIEDYFHVIDEIGRGSYGVVRRVIDKNSGNQYAAKFLRFGDPLMKDQLGEELEMMGLLDHTNIAQVIDGYEDKKRLIIVMEIVTGGDLMSRLLKEDSLTESEAAYYLKQLLLAVEYMHSRNVIHLDLKPENLLLLSKSSDELKLIDFSYSRRYNPHRSLHVKYGTPEFVSPEVAGEDAVTPASDLWSVGVIAYIILSGISPFHRESAKDILLAIKEGKWQFDSEAFTNISTEAKDFIEKLLVKDPKKRMSATDAINHKFIELANHRGLGDRINLEKHRSYVFRKKWERGNNLVKSIVVPRTLASYMVDTPTIPQVEIEVDVPVLNLPEPGAPQQPLASPQNINLGNTLQLGPAGMLEILGPQSATSRATSIFGSGSDGSSEWGREYEDEDTWYEFSSAYQTGPDTYLLPTRDTKRSVRMAGYMRNKSAGPVPVGLRVGMKERQDLRDLDREREDEYSEAVESRALSRHKYKRGRGVWKLKDIADSATDEGFPPIFKEKIRDQAYNVGDSCTLNIHVIGNPSPQVNWYRNDELLTDGGRVRTSSSDMGRHGLTILSTKPHDFGVFKCVARNKYGTVTCRARMMCGDHPSRPGRPHVTKVSDTEVFMIWEESDTDGNSTILAYRVDWHKPGDERWTVATYCIDECALVKGLRSNTTYRFRVAAVNKFGVSPYSFASVEVRTLTKGAAAIDIDSETKKILLRSRQATNRPSPERSPVSSPFGSVENLAEDVADKKKELGILDREIHLQEVDPEKFLEFGTEVWRGRFTIIRNVKPKEGKKIKRVAKIFPHDPKRPYESLREYEMLKSVRQEHIVRMYEAFLYNDFAVLVFEKLYGENVARSLSLKNKYNEQHVMSIIKQVLDALQFLHHRGIVHLNVQPDNVVMISRRRFDIKLIDFGRARKIETIDGEKVEREGTAEFMAPEKVCRENVGVAADIWGVGVLTFILLSGVSPFRGLEDDDTYVNISHVRYDAHALYHNVTKHTLKFLYQILKRNPKARLTTEECLDHRWLMLNNPMVKARKHAVFSTDRLRLFEEEYIRRRMMGAAPSDSLLKAYGAGVSWSSDEEDELFGAAAL